MAKVLLLGIIGFFLYRFFIRFLLPLIKVFRAAKQKIDESRQEMNRQYHASSTSKQQTTQRKPPQQPEGEYIDYEEVE